MVPEPDDMTQSRVIAQLSYVSSFITHRLSVGRLELLAYGSSVYLRSERHSKWKQCMTFDSLILALTTIETNENQQTSLVCITENAVQTLHLDHKKKAIER